MPKDNNSFNIENENTKSYKNKSKSDTGQYGFLLFLILILLVSGSQKDFSTYFQKFNQGTANIKNILEVISATSEGLKNTIETPQKVLKNVNESS